MLRESLRLMFDNIPDITVIAEAGDGHTAVRHALKMKPDIVLMDISMKGLNGIEATRQILAENSTIKIIALSMHSDARFVRGVLEAGASGYLLKNSVLSELMRAIHVVMDNGVYLSSEIAKTVVKGYLKNMGSDENVSYSLLTHREREIVQLLADGYSVREGASILNLSRKTVEAHRKNIMDKLDIHDIATLTKYAIREGISSL